MAAATAPETAASSLLLAALKRDNSDLREHPEIYVAEVATMLAEAIAQNPKRARSMAFNLPRNPTLRRQLLAGAITPQALSEMDLSELAPEPIKRKLAEVAERSDAQMKSRSAANHVGILTKSVRCEECGGRVARYVHQQGTDQRDWHGRKNEVWGTKHDDDESAGAITITCVACNFTWQSGEAPQECEEDEEEDMREREPPPPPRGGPRLLGCPSP